MRAARRVLREFELKQVHGTADYMFNVDSMASAGAEPKPVDHSLTYVKLRSKKYGEYLLEDIPVKGAFLFLVVLTGPIGNLRPSRRITVYDDLLYSSSSDAKAALP